MGCPLRCLWCHNPESFEPHPFLGLDERKCTSCGQCVTICPNGAHDIDRQGRHHIHRKNCILCGRCVDGCPVRALSVVGREITVQEAVNDVMRDKAYFDASGGGVTFSGGEPTMQMDFLLRSLDAFGALGVHRVVETCGQTSPQNIDRLMPHADLFLFDCKETDEGLHKQFTGASNRQILDNLRYLHDNDAKVLLRCPIIPSLNAREAHVEALLALCGELPNLVGIELLPYHDLGVSKAVTMGLDKQETYDVPAKETIAAWNARFRVQGIRVYT